MELTIERRIAKVKEAMYKTKAFNATHRWFGQNMGYLVLSHSAFPPDKLWGFEWSGTKYI